MNKNGDINGAVVNGVRLDLLTHQADLDAHTRNRFETFKTGYYMQPHPGSWTTRATTTDKLMAIPFLTVVRDMTFDRIAIHVTTNAAGGDNCRLGIYGEGTDMYPGALILDAGEVDISATGVKAITIDQSLTKGVYWLAIAAEANVTLRALSPSFPMAMFPTDFNRRFVGYEKSVSYAALADPFPSGAALKENYWCTPMLRLSSLD